jgi:hypothetical protein
MYYKDILIDTECYPYRNIQCGRASTNIKLDMAGDDTGGNISKENRYWSEITGLYWAWKNIEKTEFVGLCSYRRFFNLKASNMPIELQGSKNAGQHVRDINYEILDDVFKQSDVVLPVSYSYAWSIRRVCSMNYKDKDFSALKEMIKEVQPEYLGTYNNMMYKSNKMIGHNMFIMKWDDFQNYCEWVFSILMPLSEVINPKDYPISQVRVYGYMHELLLAVYCSHNKFRVSESQLLWINDEIDSVRFNKAYYRVFSSIVYGVTSMLGRFYPHVISNKK